MIRTNISEVKNYTEIVPVCNFPLRPLGYMQICRYPGGLFCEDHMFNSCFTILVTDGEVVYSELGRAEHHCRRGDLMILPRHCCYSWRTISRTDSFHCRHSGFSICDHGRLSILFGAGLGHLEKVRVGEELTREFQERLCAAESRQARELFYSCAIFELYSHAVEIYASGLETATEPESSASLVRQYVYYIESRLDREIGIEELAQYRNISERSLFLLFKTHMGVSPLQYIAGRKAEAAKRLLAAGGLSCDEVALQLGFSSASYFIRFFRKHTGTTPARFRKSPIPVTR